MATAKWNGQIIAKSEQFELVENNVYFPRAALKAEFFGDSNHSTVCAWKGVASYLHVTVDGKVNENAAWYYAEPKSGAANIQGYVAFWKGIEVTK